MRGSPEIRISPAPLRADLEEASSAFPTPEPIGWEEALEVGRTGLSMQSAGWLYLAYAASCVEVQYGEGTLKGYAQELDISHSSVKHQRRLYGRLVRLNNEEGKTLAFWPGVQSGLLPYYNLLICSPLTDDDFIEVLTLAHDNGWKHQRIAEEVAVRRGIIQPSQLEPPEPQDEVDMGTPEAQEGVDDTVYEVCNVCQGKGRVPAPAKLGEDEE